MASRILRWTALFVSLLARLTGAQEQARGGSISGLVRDSLLVPVARADIMLRPGGQRTRTDSAGRFAFNGVDPGNYTVVARKVGFIPETWDVKLTKSSRMDISIVLGRRLPTLDTVVTRASREC